jgi:hypothetical protein
MSDHHLDAEIAALRRLQGRVMSATNRLVWRRAQQRRAIRIATLVRMLPTLVIPRGFRRSRSNVGWLGTTTDDSGRLERVLEVVTRTCPRTLEDLSGAIPVRIFDTEKVAMARVEELTMAGRITVVLPEARA